LVLYLGLLLLTIIISNNNGSVYPYGTVWLASGASRTALSSGRTVIGESSGAQRCDTVVVEKSGWAVKSIFVLKRVV